MKKETLLLENLNCPVCAADLQRALSQMKGVRRAEVAFASGTVELEYDETAVTAADLQRTAEGFGAIVTARM